MHEITSNKYPRVPTLRKHSRSHYVFAEIQRRQPDAESRWDETQISKFQEDELLRMREEKMDQSSLGSPGCHQMCILDSLVLRCH